MTRYLTLPVRLIILGLAIAVVVLAMLPPGARHSIELKTVYLLGHFIPALAVSLAIGWISFNRRAFLVSLAVTIVITVPIISINWVKENPWKSDLVRSIPNSQDSSTTLNLQDWDPDDPNSEQSKIIKRIDDAYREELKRRGVK